MGTANNNQGYVFGDPNARQGGSMDRSGVTVPNKPRPVYVGGIAQPPPGAAPAGSNLTAKSPWDGMPLPPDVFNADGTLKNQYRSDWKNYDTGGKAMSALEQRAMSTGPSAWLGLQNKMIDDQTMALEGKAKMAANQAAGQGMGQLAMSGGLESGARERMLGNANLSGMLQAQEANRAGFQGKLSAGLADEQAKLSILQSLPGMKLQQAGFQSSHDLGNIQRDLGSKYFNYDQQMKAFTGKKMADATSSSGGGGLFSFLG